MTAANPSAAGDPSTVVVPQFDVAAPWLFVVNAKAGHNDPGQTRAAIEAAMSAGGRECEFFAVAPEQLTQVAREAAERALSEKTALIGVGGDGTVNTVAQAAHRAGCAMGFVPQGTFNYFARLHHIPPDPTEAIQVLLRSTPQPVRVGFANERLFLVNASVGLYPEMFEDREAWKRRFGRHRLVALVSGIGTILTQHRKLRLRIELDGQMRDVSTSMLFVGNNRLQLERVGLARGRQALEQGQLTAVMAHDTSMPALIWLLLRGAMGSLGEVETVESFGFQRMRVEQRRRIAKQLTIKLACDGEVMRVEQPLEFRIAEKPLYLIKPSGADTAGEPV